MYARQHEQSRNIAWPAGQVRGSRGDAAADPAAQRDGAREGPPRYAHQHEQQYPEAEAMHRQTLQLKETVLGNDHPSTLTSLNNLAKSLGQQGKYTEAEAEAMQRHRERVLGNDHPNTLASMNNVAASLGQQGKYAEAEVMHRQTLQLQETVLGGKHPDTLVSMNNLAEAVAKQRAGFVVGTKYVICRKLLEHPDKARKPRSNGSMSLKGAKSSWWCCSLRCPIILRLTPSAINRESDNGIVNFSNYQWTHKFRIE
ncbi:hypothetical protein V496_02801 [Pseudogymnoascus sp. VKM F-4515 (FW-2607)]|nr:hypothetical protein V496_02801 [Pseudogymnoascus sp. VKM F-4515 (FW-2607)]